MRLAVRLALPLLLMFAVVMPSTGMTEFRGLYVDAFHPGIKSHEEVTQMVNAAKAANFNALIVQVRKRGDAYYNSTIEPKASDIAPDYDPLADIVTQAHAAGLQVHAWLSVYEVSNEKYTSLTGQHVTKLHPEWIMADGNGSNSFTSGKVFLDPGLPAVRSHVVAIVADILHSYEVDGIHLDNIGYPGIQGGYNPASVDLFNQENGKTGMPEENDETWCRWRRDQVTALIRQIQSTIASSKPAVVLSASVPTATPDLSAKVVLEQWDVWTRENLVDFVVPMLFISDDRMASLAGDAMESAYSRHMYIGVGAWQVGDDLARRHIQDIRSAGAEGVVVYSYYGLTGGANADGTTLSALGASVFAEPASVPSMAWRQ